MFRNILVAVDGSEESTRALEAAIELSNKFAGALHILHVVRGMQVPLNPGLMEAYEELQRKRHDLLSATGEQLLNQAKRTAETKGVGTVETDVGAGDPATAIVEYAGKNRIDLIVLGSRGLGVAGMLLGSVSRKVSNTAKVACMIVR